MPILKWNTPPAATHTERGQVIGHGDHVALQVSVGGENVQGGAQTNTIGPNIELATKWSTAPYTGPAIEGAETPEPTNPWGYRSPKRANRCMANGDTCMAWAVNKYDKQYCNPHGRISEGKSGWPGAAD